ncbi:hypothetical protein MVEN_02509400 [Mycena venus]|uniref:Uncharacterized protein n=1 Tax=Mycena venus TaxID=2733690 RepID=A0A8H6U0B3_9AGAR|nr:hypothetical protein MVEN_02509400 [Mycena venus]
MLLLLALVVRNISVTGNSLESRDEPLSCDDINSCRTLFSIISGCLGTIFACTWVSVHPNVPPPGLGNFALSWRRFCMMLVAVIAPEVMAGFAARQFLDARWFSKEYEVSMTHGFFFTMGGFVSQSGHHPIVERRQLHPDYLAAIQRIRVEDIEYKSKGDSLSKGFILLQGLWFTTQCLARIQQHLVLTELEVATLAFQSVNIFIWLLWWRKPLDAQQPIMLRLTNELTEQRYEPPESPTITADGIKPELSGNSAVSDSVASTSVLPSLSTHTDDNKLLAGVEGGQSSLCKIWKTLRMKLTWFNLALALVSTWFNLVLASVSTCFSLALALASTTNHTVDGIHSNFNPESSISVPSFWSMDGPYHEYGIRYYVMVQFVMGTIFGAIHYLEWNVDFPSVHEMWMWRSYSLAITALPFLLTLSVILAALYDRKMFHRLGGRTQLELILIGVCASAFTILVVAYIVARLILIILSFTTLRALPPGAFVDVNWSIYIPHF